MSRLATEEAADTAVRATVEAPEEMTLMQLEKARNELRADRETTPSEVVGFFGEPSPSFLMISDSFHYLSL